MVTNVYATESEALKEYSDCVDKKTDFYLMSGDSADSIAVAALYSCQGKQLTLKKEILKKYVDKYPNTPVSNIVEGEILDIDKTLTQTSIVRTLNNKIKLNIKSNQRQI